MDGKYVMYRMFNTKRDALTTANMDEAIEMLYHNFKTFVNANEFYKYELKRVGRYIIGVAAMHDYDEDDEGGDLGVYECIGFECECEYELDKGSGIEIEIAFFSVWTETKNPEYLVNFGEGYEPVFGEVHIFDSGTGDTFEVEKTLASKNTTQSAVKRFVDKEIARRAGLRK